jgi:rfaE bifunctional protein kinase chain/domain
MTAIKETLTQAIPKLAQHTILVIGDVLLDEYLIGTASRLSREAPIPVLDFESRQIIPGGAANPAMNIAALGGRAIQIGLIGADTLGTELADSLLAANIEADGLVIDPERATTLKTRVVSGGSLRFPQQLARIDRIDRRSPDPAAEAAIIQQIRSRAVHSQAMLVSDYRNGMLTPAIVRTTLAAAVETGNLLVVDSQGNLDKYHGYHIVRANQRDTERYLGRALATEADFAAAASELLTRLAAQGIVIGRGAEGVSLLGQATPYRHFRPANVTEVFDVTGAGDTSIAVLTLSLVAGLDLAQAARLANYAAGLVVQKLGNATATPAELHAAIERWHPDTDDE